MGLGASAAVVIGSFPIGESDRVVTFFSRDFGRVRGVAKAARRLRSRFGGALELFTLGQLMFFDTGHSDLVRIDHFDVIQPFAKLRESLETLGEAAWVVEIVARTTGERDRQPALYGLLVRALRALETAPRPALGEGGGVCDGCRSRADAVPVGPATVAAMERLRSARWEDAVATPVGRAGPELRALLDTHLSRLSGQPTRSGRFLRELQRLEPTSGGHA